MKKLFLIQFRFFELYFYKFKDRFEIANDDNLSFKFYYKKLLYLLKDCILQDIIGDIKYIGYNISLSYRMYLN